MRLKSYFTRNVESALALARQELGPEAMLVRSRKAPPEAAHLGQYEVVFAAPGDGSAGPAPETSAPDLFPPASPAPASLSRLSAEVAGLRRQIERMAAAVARSGLLASLAALPDELREVFSSFLGNEMDPDLAFDILSRLRAGPPCLTAAELRQTLIAELESRFQIDGRLGRGPGEPRIVALVGPCGSGKTTTLVKLAVREGLKARRSTQILTMDNYRIAAAEQLRSYAAILGVGFQPLETIAALAQALEEHRRKGLILIDTPGYSLADLDGAADLARLLAGHPDIDTHLVLTASMKSADLSRVVDRFEVFQPGKLLFTRLDETESFGPIFSQAARTGKPISFLATGQQVPEDLEPATTGRILDLLWRGHCAQAAAAA